jgi:DNA-binding response OmpR family regulator
LPSAIALLPHTRGPATIRLGGNGNGNYVNPKGNVVVLEEDPFIRPLLDRWLREAGYRIHSPGNAGQDRPVLVIADVADPQSAQERIRALQEYAAPILILSARFRRGLAGSEETARWLGVKKVLPKPFTRSELLDAVRESLEP